MKTPPLLLCSAAATFVATLVTTSAAQADDKPAKAAAPAKKQPAEKTTRGNDMLKRAVTVMSGLTGYHASGTFSAGGGKATISGAFGVGTVDMQVQGFDGKTVFRRAVKDKFFISHDTGKTWQEDSNKDMTSLLSIAVTSPLSATNKLWEQGDFAIVGGEKIEKEDVVHLQRPAKGEEPAMDFWLAKDAGLGLIIRKASFVIAADDGEFPVVLTYSELNEPVEIAAPDTAAKPKAKEK